MPSVWLSSARCAVRLRCSLMFYFPSVVSLFCGSWWKSLFHHSIIGSACRRLRLYEFDKLSLMTAEASYARFANTISVFSKWVPGMEYRTRLVNIRSQPTADTYASFAVFRLVGWPIHYSVVAVLTGASLTSAPAYSIVAWGFALQNALCRSGATFAELAPFALTLAASVPTKMR